MAAPKRKAQKASRAATGEQQRRRVLGNDYVDVSLAGMDDFNRELITFIELHLELVARELYGQAFFGGTVSEGTKARAHKLLVNNIAGFKRLARFGPYIAGDSFGMADCAAWVSLPLVAMASKAVLGEDLLAAGGVDWKPYAKLVGERQAAVKVAADRKADQERIALLKAQG